MIRLLLLATLLTTLPPPSLFAAGSSSGSLCGTSPETTEKMHQIRKWVQSTNFGKTSSPAVRTRFHADFFFVAADSATAPFDDPVDLEGSSLLFVLKTDTNDTYEVQKTPLQYEDEIGNPLIFEPGELVKNYRFTGEFRFPIARRIRSQLFLSVNRGIHFTEPASLPTVPPSDTDLLFLRVPLISPLFDYQGSPSARPDLFVNELSDRVVITWRSPAGSAIEYDLQAVLFQNGNVRFSYRKSKQMAWGAVVLTTGNHSAFLNQKAELLSATDPAGDVPSVFGTSRDMLDIRTLEVSRIGGTDLLEIELTVEGSIERDVLTPGASFQIFLGDSLNRLELYLYPDHFVYISPITGRRENSQAVEIFGNRILFRVTESTLTLPGRVLSVSAHTATTLPADNLTSSLDLGASGERAEMDFSRLSAPVDTARPLVEAFSLPTIDLEEIWNRLKNDFGYTDDEIDAVAIYQNFLTDIILSPFGAFASPGNPGVDGIANFSSSAAPRKPTLLHMNALEFASNVVPSARTFILTHELGHRWLYYFEIKEGDQTTHVLNPKGIHPAQYVHTPAAFPVASPSDSSCMGGTAFQILGPGSFRTSLTATSLGYSWHELYLMGLASPSEVAPWFYVRETVPPLGDEYTPPANTEVTGTRVDVTVEQIIAAMGPRNPDADASQKVFRMLFVILERPDSPVVNGSEDLSFRSDFELRFRIATGGRGRVETEAAVAPPVADFVLPQDAQPGSAVSFIDTSRGNPVEWSWTFGDGGTSSARNPTHVYAGSGTYTVTVVVRNAQGTDTISKTLTVRGDPLRRRAVRR